MIRVPSWEDCSAPRELILQTLPQDPWNPSAEKGPSTFDVTHVIPASVIQLLPLDRIGFLRPLGKTLNRGLAIPEYYDADHGIALYRVLRNSADWRRTAGADRPDLVSTPAFFDQPRGARRLLRAGGQQPVILYYSDQRSWRDGAKPRAIRHAGARHVSWSGISRF